MKKFRFIILGLIIVMVALWVTVFYWGNLRGIWPAVKNPSQDISQLIPRSDSIKPLTVPASNRNESGAPEAEEKDGLSSPFKLPDNFSLSLLADGLDGARVMAFDSSGNLLVSQTRLGKVSVLPVNKAKGEAEVQTMISGLNRPHGLSLFCPPAAGKEKCQLFIAESDKIVAYDYDQNLLLVKNGKKIMDLPNGGMHFTRTIGVGPDGRLYVSIGSDCNACYEQNKFRAKIFSLNKDGSDIKEAARGLRNAVFFTWQPTSGKMWTTEMGRDFLGDSLPPDEINIIEAGKNYGWPICYGKNIHDSDFDKNVYIKNPCDQPEKTPSYIDLPAHSAPLGLAFIPEQGWPEEYRGNLLVAYHGSWNRSVPTGYKVVRVKLDRQGNVLGIEDFITGWLSGQEALGRPVDILALPDGVIYISDDKAGVVYKVVYNGR